MKICTKLAIFLFFHVYLTQYRIKVSRIKSGYFAKFVLAPFVKNICYEYPGNY